MSGASHTRLRAGSLDDLHTASGEWLIVEIGFGSRTRKSTAVVHYASREAAKAELELVFNFGDACREVLKIVNAAMGELNIVIEAPLSCAFDGQDNPIGRTVERRHGEGNRFWHTRGASMMLAALVLLRELRACAPGPSVRIFEGFASFKSSGQKAAKGKNKHLVDAEALWTVIQSHGKRGGCFREPEWIVDTKRRKSSSEVLTKPKIVSLLTLAGVSDAGAPAIVEVGGSRSRVDR